MQQPALALTAIRACEQSCTISTVALLFGELRRDGVYRNPQSPANDAQRATDD